MLAFHLSCFSMSLSDKAIQKLYNKAVQYEEKNEYEKAKDCWIDLLEDIPMTAGFRLGEYYKYGLGVSQNIDCAIRYYTRSAEAGFFMAQHCLGDIYYNQDSLIRNDDKAYYWNKIAATNIEAADDEYEISSNMYYLARCYEYGIGVVKNQEISDIWMALAAFLDMPEAQKVVSERYSINTDWDTFDQEDSVSDALLNHFLNLVMNRLESEASIEVITIKMRSAVLSKDLNTIINPVILNSFKYAEDLFQSDKVPLAVKLDLADALLMYYKDFKYDLYKVEQIEAFLEENKAMERERGQWYVQQYMRAAIDVTNIIEKK